MPLSTYIAALFANTPVPLWHQAHRQLPFVFGAGAALSAGAVAVMTTPPAHAKPAHAKPARRVALAGAVTELVANELMEKQLGELGEPDKRGVPSKFKQLARGCIFVGSPC